MTQFLPPNLLALFAPRDPIPYLPPPDKLPHEKKTSGYSGVAAYVNEFEDPKDTPPPTRIETREERQERKRREKAEQVAYKLEQDIALWAPHDNPAATSDPYKTLFVARVNYDTSESKLRREFEVYGPINKIIIVHDKNAGSPRGYAFIEYEREGDMHSAYKHADGKKIDGRRVLVDVERGRTVKGWLPRRLGGGLGGTRRGGPDINMKHSGRDETRPDDRYVERDRVERPERRRSRSRSRDRRRRSRSRSRDRHRERHKRDRSRDRGRGRDREAVVGGEKGSMLPDMMNDVGPDIERKERRRSRSRDRDRKRRRSRSRDRNKRRDYDRGDRDSGRRDRGDRDERIRDEGMMMDVNNQDDFNNNMNYEGDFNNYGGPEGGYNAY